MSVVEANAAALAADLDWLSNQITVRLQSYFESGHTHATSASAPPLPAGPSTYAAYLRDRGLDGDARLLLALALAPHLRPAALDVLFTHNDAIGRPFTEFGGARHDRGGPFLPTGETALFVLAGADMAKRFAWQAALSGEHVLLREGALRLDPAEPGMPPWAGSLTVAPHLIDAWTLGRSGPQRADPGFPATPLRTDQTWDDLVVSDEVRSALGQIATWAVCGPAVLDDWGFRRRGGAGYRALLYGPPGTGKTLSAALLGQRAGREVVRVDLSTVVSKYIGETEKNLARLFEAAEGRDWILFFDEADALFGRRAEVKDAHDRFANQQVSYLLQRLESFSGVVLLATNLAQHLDPAFKRRFHQSVRFSLPDERLREDLWTRVLRPPVRVTDDVAPAALASTPLSPAAITNAVRTAALLAVSGGAAAITPDHLDRAVAAELSREGRSRS